MNPTTGVAARSAETTAQLPVAWSTRDLGVILGTLVVALAVQAIVHPALERASLETGLRGVAFSVLPTIVTACAVLLRARQRGFTFADLGFVRPRSPRPVLFAWLVAVSAGPLTAWSASTLGAVGLSSSAPWPEANQLNVATLGLGGLLLLAIELSLFVPLLEELIFRGVIHRSLRLRWSWFPSAVASGGVFSLAHFSGAEVMPLFIVGFVLAWSYERSGSLWGAVIPHGGLNALVLLATIVGRR